MFVLVLVFCFGGDPAAGCAQLTFRPKPMESAAACYAEAPEIATRVMIADGWLIRGFLPFAAQCFEKTPDEPGAEG